MKNISLKNILTKINLLGTILVGTTIVNSSAVLAQTFEPSWEVIEINQGPYSENMEASQVFNTALNLYYRGNLEYAALAFQKALTYDPNIDKAHYLLANSLYQQNRIEDAMVEYQKAIKLNPFLTKAYNNLGTILASQGKYEEAIAQYQQALQIEPQFAIAFYNMGIAFLQIKEYNQGLFYLATAKNLFIRSGNLRLAQATEKYIQCGVLPSTATPNARRAPICRSL